MTKMAVISLIGYLAYQLTFTEVALAAVALLGWEVLSRLCN